MSAITHLKAYDPEDDACVRIVDDGDRHYGCILTVREPYGDRNVSILIDKETLMGLMNQALGRFRKQGYRARRVGVNKEGFEVSIKEVKV